MLWLHVVRGSPAVSKEQMSQQSEIDTDDPGASRNGRRARMTRTAARRERAISGAIARAVERKSAEIDVRRVPRQARGAATFNAILDATGRLLDEAGPEIVTTNLVAEVAGVNIATLYQYFPSKEAILLALFQRDTDGRFRLARDMLAGIGADDAWRRRFCDVIDAVVRLRCDQPGAGPLRQAMRAVPELQAYDRDALVRTAKLMAAELVKRGRTDLANAELTALCLFEMNGALLDLWSIGYAGGMGYQDDRIIAEIKDLSIGYLAPLLDP